MPHNEGSNIHVIVFIAILVVIGAFAGTRKE